MTNRCCRILLLPKRLNNGLKQGFTLIEVLVAVIVLTLGLIGIAGTQLIGLKNNDSSYLRTQASLFAYDIMDRMRANRARAIAGDYDQALSAFADLAAPGAGAPIAQTDRYDWYRRLDNELDTPDTKASIACNNAGICTVIVRWDDARAACASNNDPNCINDDLQKIRQIVVAGQI